MSEKASLLQQSAVPDLDALEREIAGLIVQALNLEIDPRDISPEAPLYGEGLGLDSIDILEVALIVAVPFPIAVTRPLAETVATAAALVDQVKLTGDVTTPFEFEAVAESCTVWFKLVSEVLPPEAATAIDSTYVAVESMIIWPPALDVKDPIVAMALTVQPPRAASETPFRLKALPFPTGRSYDACAVN